MVDSNIVSSPSDAIHHLIVCLDKPVNHAREVNLPTTTGKLGIACRRLQWQDDRKRRIVWTKDGRQDSHGPAKIESQPFVHHYKAHLVAIDRGYARQQKGTCPMRHRASGFECGTRDNTRRTSHGGSSQAIFRAFGGSLRQCGLLVDVFLAWLVGCKKPPFSFQPLLCLSFQTLACFPALSVGKSSIGSEKTLMVTRPHVLCPSACVDGSSIHAKLLWGVH